MVAAASWRYAVIIDAGSTGSRAHVFKFRPAGAAAGAAAQPAGSSAAAGAPVLPHVELPEAVHKTRPGLSSFSHDPPTAASSLMPLIKFAKEQVPASQVGSTPIQLLATAGLRLLANSSAEAILTEVRRVLAASGFAFRPGGQAGGEGQARVLSGGEEGLLGWLAINYATGALQAAAARQQQELQRQKQRQQQQLGRKGLPDGSSATNANGSNSSNSHLLGVLELGGGSLQVTFTPPVGALPPGEAAALALPPAASFLPPVYSRSTDGVGLQAALARWREAQAGRRGGGPDPCLPRGYSPPAGAKASAAGGSGDWAACKAGVADLLPTPARKGRLCRYTRCGLAGSFLPSTEGASFVGLDNFAYTASALGLSHDVPTSLSQLDDAAAAFCSTSWAQLQARQRKQKQQQRGAGHQLEESYLPRVCFSAALILGLLGEGLQLPPGRPLLTPSNSVTTPGGTRLEVRWPLGALLLSLMQQQQQQLGGQSGAATRDQQRHHHNHALLGAPDSDSGLSAGAAAGVALAFCLLMLALSGCAHALGVGLPGSTHSLPPLWQRLTCAVTGPGRPAGASSSSGGGGVGAGVRYMRVRPASRGGDAAGGERTTSPSPHGLLAGSGGGGGGGGGSSSGGGGGGAEGVGSIMLSVMASGAAAAAPDSSGAVVGVASSNALRKGGGQEASAAITVSSSSLAAASRTSTARQR